MTELTVLVAAWAGMQQDWRYEPKPTQSSFRHPFDFNGLGVSPTTMGDHRGSFLANGGMSFMHYAKDLFFPDLD